MNYFEFYIPTKAPKILILPILLVFMSNTNTIFEDFQWVLFYSYKEIINFLVLVWKFFILLNVYYYEYFHFTSIDGSIRDNTNI